MAVNATIKQPDSPQIVLEKLASRAIDEEKARKILEDYLGQARSESTLRRLIHALLGAASASRGDR